MNLKEWCETNRFYLKDKIDFEVDRYWDWNISITTILKLIWDPWFDFVMDNYWEQVKKAASKWTEVHKEAEDFFVKWSWVKTMNLNFTKFHTLYNVKVISNETTYMKLYNDFIIRWSVDCTWECMYDNPFTSPSYFIRNIDYKNSDKHSPKYLMQLAWYKWLNWNNWVLVYWKGKLKVVEYNWELDSIWEELVDYFLTLYRMNENLVPMYVSQEEDWNILASRERTTRQAFIVMVTKKRLEQVLSEWSQNEYKFLFDNK